MNKQSAMLRHFGRGHTNSLNSPLCGGFLCRVDAAINGANWLEYEINKINKCCGGEFLEQGAVPVSGHLCTLSFCALLDGLVGPIVRKVAGLCKASHAPCHRVHTPSEREEEKPDVVAQATMATGG